MMASQVPNPTVRPSTAAPRALRVTAASPTPRPAEPEDDLIRRAQAGDRAAFAGLVDRYWDRLHRWLYHLSHDRHAAEDLAQDTFLKAFAHLNSFKAVGARSPRPYFAAWLFRIAHNAFANHCRDRRRGDPLPDELPASQRGPDEQAVSRESLQELAQAVERLPTEFRAALLLRVEQEMPFSEIAEVLGLTEETARWRVFKARRLLLKLLSPRQEQGTP
jgi:RNA polymerase sigma-70 factor (ECF subfamily)